MAVGIDQSGGDGHSYNIHHLIYPFGVKTFLFADSLNQSSLYKDGIRIKTGLEIFPETKVPIFLTINLAIFKPPLKRK